MDNMQQGYRTARLVMALGRDWMLTVSIVAGALAFAAWVAGS